MAAAICIPTLDPKGFQFPSSHLNVQSGEAGSVSTPHTRPCGSEQADINKGSQAPFPDWSGTCWLQGPVSGLASHPCWVRVYTVYLASRPDFLWGAVSLRAGLVANPSALSSLLSFAAKLGFVVYVCHPNTWEVEANRSVV